MITVTKRTGAKDKFDKEKIETAINKASKAALGYENKELANAIANSIKENYEKKNVKGTTVEDIEKEVYFELVKRHNPRIAKSYESYRAVQEYKRKNNTTDNNIIGLVRQENEEVMNENSNKNATVISTQRDLIAGEVSKDIAKRRLLPSDLLEAHENGAIHVHDLDYMIQPSFNCCLVNMRDILDNGTVINGKTIDSPKSFQVACNIMTQVIAVVASNQQGGQSVNVSCLGKYLRKSYDKNFKTSLDVVKDIELAEKMAKKLTQRDLESGIQTIQYQINTLCTSNGQTPFVTLFLHINDEDEYKEEVAKIIYEILKQRIVGIKNSKGIYTTPTFPKLVYVLDENNIHKDSEYYYVTQKAIECTSKRFYPDYISAKVMREHYEGNVFSPMGCRSFLSPWKDEDGNYKWEGRFNFGVTSLNLPQIGILAMGDKDKFYKILDNRLELIKKAGLFRYDLLKDATSDVSPMHWQHGAIARLKPHEPIRPLLENGYSTVSVGYIGLYETSVLMVGESHTTEKGKAFALEVLKYLEKKAKEWREETGLGFSVYSTPAESLCYRFARIDKERFGDIKDVTDKGYYTNSFHVDVREEISAFEKFKFESTFQEHALGGCISFVEVPNMSGNLMALETLVKYIYDNIQYAEFNIKSDHCLKCGFDGEIKLNEDNVWTCPQCGNQDKTTLEIIRRTCGYLGSNFWNEGKTKEIKERVLHL